MREAQTPCQTGSECNRGLAPPTAATVAAAAPPSVAAATAPAVLPRLGLVDGQLPPLHLLAAQRRHGRLGFLVGAHLHEPEPLGPARVPVHDDLGRLHPAE